MIVLVTGANGALGMHVVRELLAAGAMVAGTSRRITQAEFASDRFHAVPADLADLEQAQKTVNAVIARFGKLDAVIHTAGGFAGGKPVHETPESEWESMIGANLRPAVNLFRAAIPRLRETKGSIVAFGGRLAVEPAANVAAYNASKAALVSLVKTVGLENRDIGVRANVILPGTIDTEANRRMDPGADRSKWVSPERLAKLAVFLISDAGADITGAAIPVYGRGL